MATENVTYTVGLKDLFTSKIKSATVATNQLNDAVKKTQTSIASKSSKIKSATVATNQLNDAVKKTQTSIASKSSSSGEGGILGSLGGSIGWTAAGAAVLKFGKDVLATGSMVEQLGVSFETMLGSKTRADNLMSDIKKFALTTPFEIKDVADGAKALLAYGISAEKLIPDLKILGDITAGIGTDKMPQLILAFGQVKTATKLTGNELRQFTEAGVPIISALAKHFKKADAEIVNMVHDGKVGFSDVESALKSLTEKGGLFFNLMEKQSKTTGGKISNMADSYSTLTTGVFNLGKPLINGFIDELTGSIRTLSRAIELLDNVTSAGGKGSAKMFRLTDAFGVRKGDVAKVYKAGFNESGIENKFDEGFKSEREFLDSFARVASMPLQLSSQLEKATSKSDINGVIKKAKTLRDLIQADEAKGVGGLQASEFKTKLNLLNDVIKDGDKKLASVGLGAASSTAGVTDSTGIKTPLNDIEGRRATNINVTIGNLINTQEIHAQNLTESATKIADEVKKALLTMLNDVNYMAK